MEVKEADSLQVCIVSFPYTFNVHKSTAFGIFLCNFYNMPGNLLYIV